MRKRLLLITAGLFGVMFCGLISLPECQAAAPVIFYSDLVSGPNSGGQDDKGVWVTINGKNFGDKQGSSSVSIGGGHADNYPVWTDTQVTFQLGPKAKTGSIVLTTPEGKSNGVAFKVRPGAIFCVDASSSADPGYGSFVSPWRSPRSFYENMKPGDTCYFRKGTYSGKYGNQGWHHQVSFESSSPSGQPGNEIAWVAYPGEKPRFQASTGDIQGNFDLAFEKSYYVIAGFELYSLGGRSSVSSTGTGNRIINNFCKQDSTFAYGIIGPHVGNGTRIYGNTLTGQTSGNKLAHALYMGYGASNVDFGWNHIYGNNVGAGPLISNHTDGGEYLFANNKFHDNIIDGGGHPARAIGFAEQARGSSAEVYNNLIIGCGGKVSWDACVYVNSGKLELYNNTFYNIKRASGGYAVRIDDNAEDVRIRNNIFHVADGAGKGYITPAGGSGILISSNCYTGGGKGPQEDSSAVNADPCFIDPANGNFSLQAASPCINRGQNISGKNRPDHTGTPRPQAGTTDIGAFEYRIGAPSNLDAVTMTDGSVTIGWQDNADNETGFIVEKKISRDYDELTRLGADSVLYTDGQLEGASSYRVKAFQDDITSDYSNELSVGTGGGGGGGGGGCFIATAAYGSPLEKEVRSLSRLRDNWLLKRDSGRIAVGVYYGISPGLADYIEDREAVRSAVRIMLRPLVWTADLLG